jgi:3-hydroxyacyl-CoA dehydrogenase/enoyl-CoA hydratase/3-hydroxybutyryl-CoA epimerase
VTLTLDDPTGSANVMNEHYKESMNKAVKRVVRDGFDHRRRHHQREESLLRGGDLKSIFRVTLADAPAFFATAEAIKADLRALETLETPVVAANHSAARGSGLENCSGAPWARLRTPS